MTTGDIVAAVEARRPWRSLQYCFWRALDKCAFSAVIFYDLLFIGVDILWILVITFCAVVLELIVKPFASRIYSTHEIAELLMKRTTSEPFPSNIRKLHKRLMIAVLAMLLFAFISARLDILPNVFNYLSVAFYFIIMVFLVKTFKVIDEIKMRHRSYMYAYFLYTEAERDSWFLTINPEISQCGFTPFRPWMGLYLYPGGTGFLYFLCMLVPTGALLFLYFQDVNPILSAGLHAVLAMAVFAPGWGGLIHRRSRFYLVHREMDRLNAGKMQDPGERTGEER